MEGLTTHCRRRALQPHEKALPMFLQDHGCVVQFRNIWYRPLASRWANTTCSKMSANEADVMELRRATAAKLFAKIAAPKEVSAANLKALAEVVAYANEGAYKAAFLDCLNAYRAKKGDKREVDSVNKTLNILVRGGVIGKGDLIK